MIATIVGAVTADGSNGVLKAVVTAVTKALQKVQLQKSERVYVIERGEFTPLVGRVFSVWSWGGHQVQEKMFISVGSQGIKDAIELGMAVIIAVMMAIESRLTAV